MFRLIDIATSAYFAKVAESVCPNITVIYTDKEKNETHKAKLDTMWSSSGQDIKTVSGMHSAHLHDKD